MPIELFSVLVIVPFYANLYWLSSFVVQHNDPSNIIIVLSYHTSAKWFWVTVLYDYFC